MIISPLERPRWSIVSVLKNIYPLFSLLNKILFSFIPITKPLKDLPFFNTTISAKQTPTNKTMNRYFFMLPKSTKNYPTMRGGTIFNYESVIISWINSRCLISNWKVNG